MLAFVAVALQFPTVVWTVAVGVAAIYWLVVAVGGADIDLLGGADGGAEGAAEALEGAAGPVEAAGLLNKLSLRAVPVTVLATILALLNFLLCHAGAHFLSPLVTAVMPRAVWAVLLLVGAFALSLPIASRAIRPLRGLFQTREAPRRAAAVGRVVEVTTGEVNRGFGQARAEDGGAGLILQVRADPAIGLRRGDRALVISYDEATEAYEVTRFDDLLKKE